MKNTDIKEMNKEQRLSHLIMLTNSYKQLMIYDIASGNKIGEESWKKEFRIAVNILKGVITMKYGKEAWNPFHYLR